MRCGAVSSDLLDKPKSPSGPQSASVAPGLSTPRAAGIAGILFAVLFTGAILASRSFATLSPEGVASGVRATLRSNASTVALYLVPFAGIAFLWFVGVVRDRIGALEDRFFSTVFLGAGLLFVAMLFAGTAVLAALLSARVLTTATAEFGRALARSLMYIYGARCAGVFTLVTSTIAFRTHLTPKWASALGFAVGLTLLLGTSRFDLLVLLFPLWVATLSVIILVHARERS